MTDALAPMTDRPARHASEAATAALPAILYGLRVSAGVCLALYVAFFLQLENPSWAGTSAAIVAQPVLGASLRKGAFRLIGTVVGAVASVLLTACFPQNRLGFLFGLALWCAACSFMATLLVNFAAYGAMLAGYTLVIIASSSIAAPDQVFLLAVSRASEIGLGVVCGTVVMAVTDIGHSREALQAAFAGIVGEVASGLASQLAHATEPDFDRRDQRRALVARVAGLDPLLDQAIGESPSVSARRTTLRAGVNGLFMALSAWCSLAAHLAHLPPEQAKTLGDNLPGTFADPPGEAGDLAKRNRWGRAANALRGSAADTATSRLAADRVAAALDGLGRAANAMVLLTDSRQADPIRAVPDSLMPDALPALVNAGRVFIAVLAAVLLYVVTAWPSGPTFVTFVAVTVLLLSPRNEQAFAATIGFGAGTLLTAVLAAIAQFALLPNHEGFGSFAAIVAVILVPLAALSTRPDFSGVVVPASMNFIPLLGPTNAISYNPAGFYNSALAIVGGCLAGAAVLRAIPPVAPETRARRLAGLTLADLRRLARRPRRFSPDRWRSRVYGRLIALPQDTDPAHGSQLLAALTVGLQTLALRDHAPLFHAEVPLAAFERALSTGNVGDSLDSLRQLGDGLRDQANTPADPQTWLRAQAAAQEIAETLKAYPAYFGAAIR